MTHRSSWGSNEPSARKGYRRLRYKADIGDGRGYMRHSKTIRGSKRAGDAELARLRTMYERQREDGPRPTFAQCWERWYLPELNVRLAEGTVRPSTVKIYANEWKMRVGERWGGTLFTDVDPVEYQAWLLSLPNAQIARLSNVLVGNLVQCAVMRGVKGIEFKKVRYRLPKAGKADASAARVYKLEELSEIAEYLKGTILEVPMILCAFGSCRVGESCAPGLVHVREARSSGMRLAVVDIRHSLSMRGRELEPVKNPDSERPVVIPEPWGDRVLEIAEGKRSEGLLFLNDDGLREPVGRAIINQRWRETMGDSPFEYLPMQKLRNSWQTFMRWELGVAPDLIDKMMGHASRDVRSRYYDRPDEELFAETVAKAYIAYRSGDGRDK